MRLSVPEADAIIDKRIPVLDKGVVSLVDYMGNDLRVVESARASLGETSKGYQKDKDLINYLMENWHTTPFEHVVFEFYIKCPIFVARQLLRHRTARPNEISGRYVEFPEEIYIPSPDAIAFQSKDNKQGRSTEEVPEQVVDAVKTVFEVLNGLAYNAYTTLIGFRVARELSRSILPLGLYTEMRWQIDLHNLLHFLQLRLHEHAQLEIREYAKAMADIVKRVCPVTWEAFEEHRLYAITFSRSEIAALSAMIRGQTMPLEGRKLKKFERKMERVYFPETIAV